VYVIEKTSQQQFDDYSRKRQRIVGENAGHQHIGGGGRSNMKTPQDALLTKGTSVALSPQKLPMTLRPRTDARRNATSYGIPLAKMLEYRKKKPSGITMLKKKNILLRRASRTRMRVKVRRFVNPVASFP